MTSDQIKEIRKRLSEVGVKEVDLVEVCHLATFEADIGDERITVEIRDFAPDCHGPEIRYQCCFKTEHGPVLGNGAQSIEAAIVLARYKLTN